MAATFISALVIKHMNDVYLNPATLAVGSIMSIPTPGAGGVPDGDFWAQPITGNGIVTGFDYIPCAPTDTVPPTVQSFHVFKLTNRFGNDKWVVRGTTTAATAGSPASCGYIQASADAECCAVSPCKLPTDTPVLAGCHILCQWDSNSKYFTEIALPVLSSNLRYYPYGYYNNVLLPAAVSTGYATKALLLAFLNAGTWGTIGTWTIDAGSNQAGVKVTQASGDGTSVVCVGIVLVNPSA